MTRIALFLAFTACSTHVTAVDFVPPAPAPVALDAPGPLTHRAVVSARWAVPRSGLVDLTDPRAAGLPDDDHPIVLPVHVLTHPTHGTFVIDTGMPAADLPVPWWLRGFLSDVETVEPLAGIIGGVDLAGVLLTHAHLDHVLGLVDVPPGVPIHGGAGEELAADGLEAHVTFGVFDAALDGRPLVRWRFDSADVVDLDGVPAIDVLGDGSLYALDAHGHTPGSTAYLARTVDGPVLFTGDCSHTRWGWDHGVTPGTYTADHAANAESLDALRDLAAAHPTMRVEVGHEVHARR